MASFFTKHILTFQSQKEKTNRGGGN